MIWNLLYKLIAILVRTTWYWSFSFNHELNTTTALKHEIDCRANVFPKNFAPQSTNFYNWKGYFNKKLNQFKTSKNIISTQTTNESGFSQTQDKIFSKN